MEFEVPQEEKTDTAKRTTSKRKKEFLAKLAQHENEFGGISTIMTLYSGLTELLIDKDICTELEIIKAVESALEKTTIKNRERQARQSNMM